MKIEKIHDIITFQRWLRNTGHRLIRAIPNEDESFTVMYIKEK